MLDDLPDGSTDQYEPDEPDPEAEYTPDIPSVSIPDTSDADVPPELARVFWNVVLAANIGLFAVALGLMVGVFQGQWRLGGGAIALGAVALLLGYRRYRRYQNR
ncbi:DUF7322 domain-containing protein [Halococcus sediminicola]|uniref:DUF7322 domain-containing protein n=1 Tax=Halococcus sediminicola TaxID=1264579 RepID=UPI00067849A0|nr:hypothetical protein [Halococcus sediminicola]